MDYLKIRSTQKQIRADGSRYAVPLFVTKNRKYGKVLAEKAISIKKPILVTGAHDLGKTRWLTRLHEHAPEIWGTKNKHAPLFLDTISPLSAWVDTPALASWWDQQQQREQLQDPNTARKPWKQLKQHERAEALPLYCEDTKALVFIDDAHKLSGRKLQLARECLLASRLFVISASEEQRIPPNLRNVILRREPQIFRLDSDVSYDATKILMWSIIAICIMAGAWEAALILGGLQTLGTGRRAARAD